MNDAKAERVRELIESLKIRMDWNRDNTQVIPQGFINTDSIVELIIQEFGDLKANDYQEHAGRTLIDKPDFKITDEQVMIVWCAIGLGGEAGEVEDLIKKGIFHQQGLDIEKLKKELGDVLWYVAALCSKLGLTMEDVMQHNLIKLQARYPEGYDPARTRFRDGVAS